MARLPQQTLFVTSSNVEDVLLPNDTNLAKFLKEQPNKDIFENQKLLHRNELNHKKEKPKQNFIKQNRRK